MAKIRGRDTQPELRLRRALHARGLRFRPNAQGLPGTPDIYLPRYRSAIFVHGCFWHGHDCALGVMPSTRREFWAAKFERNRQRDREKRTALENRGIRVLEVYECAWRGRGLNEWIELVDAVERWLEGDEDVSQLRG